MTEGRGGLSGFSPTVQVLFETDARFPSDGLFPGIVRPDLNPPMQVDLSTGMTRRQALLALVGIGAAGVAAGCGISSVAESGSQSQAGAVQQGSSEFPVNIPGSGVNCVAVKVDQTVCVGRSVTGELFTDSQFVNSQGQWQHGGGGVLHEGQTKLFGGRDKGLSIVVDSEGNQAVVIVSPEVANRAPEPTQMPDSSPDRPNVPEFPLPPSEDLTA